MSQSRLRFDIPKAAVPPELPESGLWLVRTVDPKRKSEAGVGTPGSGTWSHGRPEVTPSSLSFNPHVAIFESNARRIMDQ